MILAKARIYPSLLAEVETGQNRLFSDPGSGLFRQNKNCVSWAISLTVPVELATRERTAVAFFFVILPDEFIGGSIAARTERPEGRPDKSSQNGRCGLVFH